MIGTRNSATAYTPRIDTGSLMYRYRLRERLPEILVLMLGLLLSLWLAWATHRWDTEQRTVRMRENVGVYVQAIGQQLQSLVAAVQSLAQFYNHSDTVRFDELALFTRAAVDATAQERRQQVRGFAVGAMRLGVVMEQVIASLPPLGLDLVLLDANLPGAAGLLHVHSSRTRGPAMALDAAALIHGTDGQAIPLEVAGRTLVLHAIPAPGAYPASGWPWALMGFSIVTSLSLFILLRYRRHAVARLREREEHLRLALDATQLGIYDWDLVINRMVFSPQQEWHWGFEPGEFDGTYDAFMSRVHPDDRPTLAAEIARSMAERRRYSCEMRVVWPDWSVHWVIGLGECIFDAAGRAVRMTGGTMEITDRKRAEADLLAGKAQMEAALTAMTDAVFISDTEGSLTSIRPLRPSVDSGTKRHAPGPSPSIRPCWICLWPTAPWHPWSSGQCRGRCGARRPAMSSTICEEKTRARPGWGVTVLHPFVTRTG